MVNHGIPLRKDKKTYGKASNSYRKIEQLVVNHQIPLRKYKKTYGKPSDSYEKRYENIYNTIRFL